MKLKYNHRILLLSFIVLILQVTPLFSQQPVEMLLDAKGAKNKISRNIYGQFSEDLGRSIYGGFWVDSALNVPKQDRIRMDVVKALRAISIPVLRWPGGCFADQYHWQDGIGPRNQRTRTVNTTWGMVSDDNSFGTQEFLELCGLLHCQPYIAANVGTGTPREMEAWLEYLNYNGKSSLTELRKKNGRDKPWGVSFWGVGNESWGCGGDMTPEYYANQYRRYSEFAKNYPGAPLKLIASGANGDDYHWTDVVMNNIPLSRTWGLSLHYYTIVDGWDHKGSATNFTERQYFKGLQNCLKMETVIDHHEAIMDKYDPGKKIALVVDEWGIWTDPEPGTNPAFLYQQNSLRDALIAASTLNIFNNHCDRVKMANLAQTVNVLQSLILTHKDSMLLTPTYYVFKLYRVHQDATLLPVKFSSPDYVYNGEKIPAVNVSASRDSDGVVHLTLVNLDPLQKIPLHINLAGISFTAITGQILTSDKVTSINTFQHPDHVKPEPYLEAQKLGDVLELTLPSKSIVMLALK